jgi:hypothetical protein
MRRCPVGVRQQRNLPSRVHARIVVVQTRHSVAASRTVRNSGGEGWVEVGFMDAPLDRRSAPAHNRDAGSARRVGFVERPFGVACQERPERAAFFRYKTLPCPLLIKQHQSIKILASA